MSDLNFYKEKKKNSIFWVDNALYAKGEHLFSFDKKKIYNLFADYPHNMTAEEIAIFDKEEPYWCDFFKDRK
ncbi:MAG: hypothetical protein LBU90_10385 [Bacteroidales bacterium]|jgi:hypothetical protein|nr:hypothetical protein [Bacteroidales bacterium]